MRLIQWQCTPALSLEERENDAPHSDKSWRTAIPSDGRQGTLSFGALPLN